MSSLDRLRINLEELLAKAAQPTEHDLLVSPLDVIERIFEPRKAGYEFPAFGKRIAFRPGELTMWCGMGGSGKSQLVGQVIAWMLAAGERATIASLEMPMEDTLRRMLTQIYDAPPDWSTATTWASLMDGRLYLYDQVDRVPADRLLAMVRVAATELSANHIVIDSLTKCGLPQDGDGYLSKQTDFVDSLQRTVKHLGVHCHLVVHLRKGEPGRGGRRGMHDIRGASQISDLADNVLILERNTQRERVLAEASVTPESQWSPALVKLHAQCLREPDAVLQVEKQRATGWIGDINLDYHARSGQFIPQGQMQAFPYHLQ